MPLMKLQICWVHRGYGKKNYGTFLILKFYREKIEIEDIENQKIFKAL